MRTDDLDYHLPPELIATRPAEPRDAARLLVHHVRDGRREHRLVRDLPEYLGPDDALVFNQTSVIPARLAGRRADSGGSVSGLFLEEVGPARWRVMLRSNGRLTPGRRIELLDAADAETGHALELLERDEHGTWVAALWSEGAASGVLLQVGRTPLPPYILRARGAETIDDARDRRWYQTVFADPARSGSVAAPTAGLHFTPEMLAAIDARGARRLHLTLHVGPGTFKPISADSIHDHPMHEEWFEVPAEVLAALRARRAGGPPRRLFAVGTTSVRALESLPDPLPDADGPIRGDTDLLIAPPHEFRHVDGLLTNFHLPRSTLLALVAARIGLERVHDLYREAIDRGYRFYSYGDAMLILP